MKHVRSIMNYADVERIPAAVALMRQLLWADPMAISCAEGYVEAAALSKLCRVGQVVLQEEEEGKR